MRDRVSANKAKFCYFVSWRQEVKAVYSICNQLPPQIDCVLLAEVLLISYLIYREHKLATVDGYESTLIIDCCKRIYFILFDVFV